MFSKPNDIDKQVSISVVFVTRKNGEIIASAIIQCYK